MEELLIPFQGDSMKPTLRSGDRLIVQWNQKDFELGDIVICRSSNEWVAHRVVALEPTILLKGDRSPHLHSVDQPLGVVVGRKTENEKTEYFPNNKVYRKLMSWMSLQTQNPSTLRRRVFLIAMALFHWTAQTWKF